MIVDRPDAQAIWRPKAPVDTWRSDAQFSGGDDEEKGKWRYTREPPAFWPVTWNGLTAHSRCTGFRHVGLFPEHAVHWAFAQDEITARAAPRVLNLFGYTGMMSLA